MRATNSTASPSLMAFCSDSIGTACRTLANLAAGAAPTLRAGLSSRTSSGKRASIASLRARSAS